MARIRYFAAAAELAGTETELRAEPTLGALRAALAVERPGLSSILPRCAVLVAGARSDDDTPLDENTLIDVLPPFAGG